jgi:hypothetical protein
MGLFRPAHVPVLFYLILRAYIIPENIKKGLKILLKNRRGPIFFGP